VEGVNRLYRKRGGRHKDFAEKERIGVLILASISERYAASLVVAALGTHLAQAFSGKRAYSMDVATT